MPFVPVPRRNPETSRCEVRKSVRDSFGVPRTRRKLLGGHAILLATVDHGGAVAIGAYAPHAGGLGGSPARAGPPGAHLPAGLGRSRSTADDGGRGQPDHDELFLLSSCAVAAYQTHLRVVPDRPARNGGHENLVVVTLFLFLSTLIATLVGQVYLTR